MILQLKKHKRIIIGFTVIAFLCLATFKLLPIESKLFLITDIANLRKGMLPMTIILSLLFSFSLIFRRSEFTGGKFFKGFYVLYLLMMSYIMHDLISNFCMTIALKTNRLSTSETTRQIFVPSTIATTNGKGEKDSKLWVVMHDEIYEVRGRIINKLYEDDVDSVFMDYDDFMKISEKKEFEITMQNGLLGIPFNPKLLE